MKHAAIVAVLALALGGCGPTAEERHQERLDYIRRMGELAQACRDAGGDFVFDDFYGNRCEFPPGPEGGE